MGVQVEEVMVAAIRGFLEPPDRDAEVEVLDRGFGNLAIRFGSSVARVAGTLETARSHVRESLVLPVLDGRLPVAVPAPARSIPAGPGLPFGALLHPFLPGRVMAPGDAVERPELAVEIAACLATLHALPPEQFPKDAVLPLEPLSELTRLDAQTRDLLRRRSTPAERTSLDRLIELARRALPGRERVVCHGDPWFGNMLISRGGRLSALLDFEAVCIADPTFDLAAQTYLDPPSAERTIDAYVEHTHPLDAMTDRVRGYLLIRELSGLAYGVRNGMADEIEHALADLVGVLG